jgi:hypothetical protein
MEELKIDLEELRIELEVFLRHVSKACTDEYGHLLVVDTKDEQTRKDYESETIEGIVDIYLTDFRKMLADLK